MPYQHVADILPAGNRLREWEHTPDALWNIIMRLISLPEFIFAIIGGGLFGVAGTMGLLLAIKDDSPDASELLAGGWIGFALICAFMMIKNMSNRRSTD